MTSDELVLCEEAIIRRLLFRVVLTEREELLEAVPDNFQAGQSAGRAWLERRVVTAKRWVEIVNRDGERRRSVTGAAAFRDIRNGGLGYESLLIVPERLRSGDSFQVSGKNQTQSPSLLRTCMYSRIMAACASYSSTLLPRPMTRPKRAPPRSARYCKEAVQ